MSVSDDDQERISRLLLQDVDATVGPGYESVVRSHAAGARAYAEDQAGYLTRVVGTFNNIFTTVS